MLEIINIITNGPAMFIRNASSDTYPNSALYLVVFILIAVYIQKTSNYANIDISDRLIFVLLSFLSGIAILHLPRHVYNVDGTKPRTILAVLLPMRIFTSVFNIDVHHLRKCLPQLLIMNTLALLVFVLFFGFTMSCLKYHHAEWNYIFCYGLAMCSIDGNVLFKLLKDFDSPDMAMALLTAEGITTLGQSIICIELFLGFRNNLVVNWYHMIFNYFWMLCCALIIGCVFGKVTTLLANKITANFFQMTLVWILLSYVLYHICEGVLYCSGILSMFVFCLYISAEKSRISLKADRRLRLFMDTWHFIFTAYAYQHVFAYSLMTSLKDFDTMLIFICLCCLFAIILARGLGVLCLYPFVFRNKRFNGSVVLAMIFSHKGVVEMNKVLILYQHGSSHHLVHHAIGYTLFTIAVQLFINNLFIRKVFRVFRCNVINYAKKSNIANCLDLLQNTRNTYMNMLKIEKHLGDVNWEVIHEAIDLHDSKLQHDVREWQYQVNQAPGVGRPSCSECLNNVPSGQDKTQQLSDIKMVMLQTQKVSFIRQSERGLMLKSNLKYLLYAVDVAMESENLCIDVDGLLRTLSMHTVLDNVKDFISKLIEQEFVLCPPRNAYRRIVYKMVHNHIYDTLMYLMAFVSIFIFYWYLDRLCSVEMLYMLSIPYTFFVLDIALKLVVYWRIDFMDGLHNYVDNVWNRFDLIMLCADTAVLFFVFAQLQRQVDYNIYGQLFYIPFLQIRNLRVLKLMHIGYQARFLILRFCNKKIGSRLLNGHGVALSVLYSYHDVLHILPTFVGNIEIRETLRNQIIKEKSKILAELCRLQYKVPWVAVTSKTKRVINISMNTMRDSVMALKFMGFTEPLEYKQLLNRVEMLGQPLLTMQHLNENNPLQVFQSQPFFESMHGTEQLYKSAIFKEFAPNECILSKGELSGGIFIITDGLASMAHSHTDDVLSRAINHGAIPIREYISDIDFHRTNALYIIVGNCIGILSSLTNRPCDCEVRALVNTKVIFLNTELLQNAMVRNSSPVNGLQQRLWKYVSANLAFCMMWKVPIYRNLRLEELYYYIEKSFVPDTCACDSVQIPDIVEDLVLIEGKFRDKNTQVTYTAPCYVPRSVRKIHFIRSRLLTIEPKLFIVPLKPELQHLIYEHLDMPKEPNSFAAKNEILSKESNVMSVSSTML